MQTKLYETLVDKHREEILAAEDYIWRHPETGFREWKTTAYMQDVFEKAGYTLVKAGDIPGFYTDIETGRPGPKLLIMAELDALSAPNHVQAVDGCAHACGHHAQCAAMAGIALALKEPGALDGLSGSVRLMCVPAEELIELDFRDGLRRAGVIHYLGGKTEFMHRGYMDGVDLAFLFHTSTRTDCDFDCHYGQNGCIAKTVRYEGVAAHAGGSPEKGVNALYAASLGLQGINAIRETLRDDDHDFRRRMRQYHSLRGDAGIIHPRRVVRRDPGREPEGRPRAGRGRAGARGEGLGQRPAWLCAAGQQPGACRGGGRGHAGADRRGPREDHKRVDDGLHRHGRRQLHHAGPASAHRGRGRKVARR